MEYVVGQDEGSTKPTTLERNDILPTKPVIVIIYFMPLTIQVVKHCIHATLFQWVALDTVLNISLQPVVSASV